MNKGKLASSQRRAFASFAVATTAALLVTGCQAPAPGGSDSSGSTGGSLSIVWESGQKNAMVPIVEEFQKANPGVTVNVEYLTPDLITSQVPQQLAAGTGPDLFRSDAGQGTPKAVLTLANRNLLAPLTGDWTSKVPDEISKNLVKDGKTYGFSTSLTGNGLLLNNEQLTKHGLAAPTTFTEVLNFCKAARDKGTVAFTAGPASQFEARTALYAMSYQTVYSKHPNFDQDLKDGKLKWTDSGWGDAIDRQLEMVKAGCFSDRFTGLDLQGAFGQLFGGQVLGMVGYASYMTFAPAGASFSFYPMPASDNPDESGMTVSPFTSIAMNAKAKNPELAQKFVDFLATPEMDSLYVKNASPTGGLIPTFYDKANPPQDQISQMLLKYLDNGKSNNFPDATFPNATVTAALETNMQKALNGNATSQQVLEAVQAAYDQANK